MFFEWSHRKGKRDRTQWLFCVEPRRKVKCASLSEKSVSVDFAIAVSEKRAYRTCIIFKVKCIKFDDTCIYVHKYCVQSFEINEDRSAKARFTRRKTIRPTAHLECSHSLLVSMFIKDSLFPFECYVFLLPRTAIFHSNRFLCTSREGLRSLTVFFLALCFTRSLATLRCVVGSGLGYHYIFSSPLSVHRGWLLFIIAFCLYGLFTISLLA